MMGSTRSSTKRRTESRTARSSSERSESTLKKSCMAGKTISGGFSASVRRDSDFSCFHAEGSPMIDGQAILVLPLVHHLVEQRLQRLIPAIAPPAPSPDRNLRDIPMRGCGAVLTESPAHPS